MSYQLGSMDPDERAGLFTEPRDEEARPRLRWVLATVVALLVMGLFAGGLWFAYVQGMRHASSGGGGGDVPLIRADERPTKIKPDKPGGMEVPDRDKLIYTQKRAAVEHLLPAPEKPMPRPTTPLVSAAQPEASSPPSTADTTAPGTLAPAAATAPGTTPGTIAAAVSVTQPQAKATSLSSPAAKTSGSRLQLGSVRSEDAARHEWDRIKQANLDLLGSLSATPVRADLGDRGVFYRIQTGPVADADRVCGELKQRKIGCIIAR